MRLVSSSPTARTRVRRVAGVLAFALVVTAGVGVVQAVSTALAVAPPSPSAPPSALSSSSEGPESIGREDGLVRDGESVIVFSDVAAVTNLTPELRQALQQAATDAGAEGVTLLVNSGWRSAPYQAQLWLDALAEYGSAEEAARWVRTAETSEHVTGDAVDIGPFAATDWLAQHGAGYGLCQTYGNESWHYELRTVAIDGACPPMAADPSQAPT